ncbi:TERF1-interacting nuclear factor 2 isoform X2 [Eucyclogobius newberryi]|uniref:TERF1-interacting nuclear factor 2 isoform X2 n=1 Tax=Eucyclogobius newberryi TaxID=166745 RepID=UPI003B5B6F44
MAARKPKTHVDCTGQNSLPFAALKLLAPPVRLVSAALWKVMKDRDVMQYGIVEEFVTSACDTVSGLLTLRHQAKLALGFRARLILELCNKQPDPKTIAVHMKRIKVSPSSSSAIDMKIQKTVEEFHALVSVLLTDKSERERFFKEDFPVVYGQKYDQELEKLLWEFLIRLDQLLPVPNLTQTVSWLSEAPPVLEECAQAATQPQLLKVLLQHQSCLGHLETAASLPPNMGDSILASLSLPPSGKLPSNEQTGFGVSDQSSMSLIAHKTAFIKPVFGLLSNDKVPFMISASQRLRSSETTNSNDGSSESHLSESNIKCTGSKEKQVGENVDQVENGGITGLKRKHIDDEDSASDQEDVLRKARCVKRRMTSNVHQISDKCKSIEMSFDSREMLKACLHNIGLKIPQIPDDNSLCSIWVSCLKSQPKVKVKKLLPSSACNRDQNVTKPRSIPPVTVEYNCVSAQSPRTNDSIPGSDNKENTPNHPPTQRLSLRLQRTEHQDSPGGNEDYVADSEDEATKNFKGRLFSKRYCKTKHGTYVPTLREYWKPCAEKRTRLGPGSKRR